MNVEEARSIVEDWFDPMDYETIAGLTENSAVFPMPLSAENADGERQLVEIGADSVVIETFQGNGWVRVCTYEPCDGWVYGSERYPERWRDVA